MITPVSLKDALPERPGGPQAPRNSNGTATRTYQGTVMVNGKAGTYQGTVTVNGKDRRWTKLSDYTDAVKALVGAATFTPMWTAQEFRTFDRLQAMSCSHIHDERKRGALWLKNFVDKHGKEKCDMMLAEVRRRAEQDWFKDSHKRKGA